MKNKRTELIYQCGINLFFFFFCYPAVRGWTSALKGSRRESKCPVQALKELNIKKWILFGVVVPSVVGGVISSHTMLHGETQPHLLWLVARSNVQADQGVRRSYSVNKGTDCSSKDVKDVKQCSLVSTYPHSYFFSLDLFTVSVQPLILIMVL